MGRSNGGGQPPKSKPRTQELFRSEDIPLQWVQSRRLVRKHRYSNLDIQFPALHILSLFSSNLFLISSCRALVFETWEILVL